MEERNRQQMREERDRQQVAFATFEPDPDGGFALSTEVADKARPPLFKQKQKKQPS